MAREGVLGADTASSRVGMGMRRPDATGGRKLSCHATTDAATPVTNNDLLFFFGNPFGNAIGIGEVGFLCG